MMEEKPAHHQLIARDLIPMMQLNLEHTPKTNQRMKVTFQQQCYRLVPDLLLLSPPPSAGDRPSEINNKPHTPPLKHSTPVVNVDDDDVVERRRPKRRQLPQIPADKKPFEKLWQIGMSRLESNNNNNKNFEQNLERQNLRRWKLTKANMLLEIKTDPTTGQTVSINIVDDDDDDDEIGNHKENVRLSSTSSSLLSNVGSDGFGGENPQPPPPTTTTSLDWSLADQTSPSSSMAEIMMMIQTPTTLQCSSTQQSASSSQPKPKQRPTTTSNAKDSSDSGISTSSLDSPSITLNDHTSEITSEQQQQQQQQTESPPEPTHRALFKFCARHPDEINLQIGDLVHIYQEFDDQWSEGLNLLTGCRGIFPTALVIDLNYSEFVFENEPPPPPTTTTIITNVNNNNDNSWIDFRIQRERFQLDFLGSIEVFKAKGEDVLDESIRRVAIGVGDATTTTTTKLGMEIPYHCWLEVSDIGIRMSDGHGNSSETHARKSSSKQQQQQHDYFFALVQITYCGYQFKNNDNLYYFAFITRHPTVQQRFACHVFRSFDTSTRTVAEAVGRAFHRFYNRFVQITLPNSMDTTTINSSTNKIIP